MTRRLCYGCQLSLRLVISLAALMQELDCSYRYVLCLCSALCCYHTLAVLATQQLTRLHALHYCINVLYNSPLQLSVDVLQPDGQLLLAELDVDSNTYYSGTTIYWQQSHAIALAGSYLKIDNDSSIGVYDDSSTCVWTSASELSSGLHVTAPHSFYTASRAYELRLQVDGNLELYATATGYIVWQSGTSSTVLPSLRMTADGNLLLTTAAALNDSSIAPLWQLCSNSAGAYMHLDDSTGSIGIYAAHRLSTVISTEIAVPLVTAADSYSSSAVTARSLQALTQKTVSWTSDPAGVYTLDFQVDYHLILYHSAVPKTVVWQTFIFDGTVNTLDPGTFKYVVSLQLKVSGAVVTCSTT
jgi:hypothetical protein